MDLCAVCEFFDGYLCQEEDSALYKRDVDPTAKCPVFVRQVAAAESQPLDVELDADSIELEEE
jgi:hypothetical protein